jgi:CspA family cold shock protein
MKLTVKLIISVAVAAVATALTAWYLGAGQNAPFLFIAFCAATLATALLVSMPLAGTAPAAASTPQKAPRQAGPRQAGPRQAGAKPAPVATAGTTSGAGTRQHGTVKWFNVSKGFGFITRDDGEEIFVHFRSIRGGGRRGLRDGQKVSFIVADSDKGPQAEDVEALD